MVIVAAVQGKVRRTKLPHPYRGAQVTAGLLDAHDAGMLRQHGAGLGTDGNAGAGGYIVQQNGQRDPVGNVAIMGPDARLAALVVVGVYQQQPVGPSLLGHQAKPQGVLGVVAAAAGNDRHPSRDPLHAKGQDLPHFRIREGGAFAGGGAQHNGVGAAGHVPIQQRAQGCKVHRAGIVKGRHQRHRTAPKQGSLLLHKVAPFKISLP